MIAKEIAVKRTLEIIFEDDKEQFELFKFSLFSEFGEILPLKIVLPSTEEYAVFPFRRVNRGGKKDFDFKLLPTLDGAVKTTIPLRVANGIVYALYPENALNFIVISSDGALRIYQYSVIGRWDGLFFVKQLLFEGMMNGNGVHCPEKPWMSFKPWGQLLEENVVKEVLIKQGFSSRFNGEEKISFITDSKKKEAFVIWYNVAMGIGYGILPDDKIAVIHWRQLPQNQLFLSPGSLISFQSEFYDKDGRLQLLGVKLL
ncbi:MAG: hypothetical protein A3H02_01355 [Candidatus Niyogibacteria bacterium RIFCSPLOWO2_12_FULL_41_13]|uniref:Uncharacterized protein n=1 Tax=Candidatus Niyogibacteria bacterium RIFCSPLOWO2_12_FULL_41_13 TaxID=1801726 RepID=A0A1G2F0U6_9BACT|nr:MAG: hypothetical protein A3H02_01355 [Candidatus Niyogibacteria bacterium RIFCSPLOWO2_12_FULL_41_13]